MIKDVEFKNYWYESGLCIGVREHYFLRSGKRHGIYEYYHRGGDLDWKYTYKNGVIEGRCEWFKGQYTMRHYKGGKNFGQWKQE